MLIKILNLSDDSIDVEFGYDLRRTSPPGNRQLPRRPSSLTGLWAGKRPPHKDRWYDVELVVDDLVWGKNIHETAPAEELIIREADGKIVLQGLLDISESGFVTVKIGRSLLVCNLVGIAGPFS